ncbi:7800_t:CDS:2, partial [Gigaspora rosea]
YSITKKNNKILRKEYEWKESLIKGFKKRMPFRSSSYKESGRNIEVEDKIPSLNLDLKRVFEKNYNDFDSNNHSWWIIGIISAVRMGWLCFHFERAHVLFHAVRFSSFFLGREEISILFEMAIVPSRYLVQWLMRQYGKCDPLLTCLKARIVIRENFDKIRELINVYGFVLFPPRFHVDFNMEFPATDCYENQKQMNIIAQAILLDHEFVNTCRKVGYTNIVAHTNDLVVQGQFLIYFSTAGTVSDTYEFVYEKMKNILEIGYHITDRALVEVLYTLGTRRGDVILRVSSTLIKCSESLTSFVPRDVYFSHVISERNVLSLKENLNWSGEKIGKVPVPVLLFLDSPFLMILFIRSKY